MTKTQENNVNIGQLKIMLALLGPEHDECPVVTAGADHAYYDATNDASFTDIVDEGKGNFGEWYGNPEDYGYKTLQSMKRSGNKIVKGLVIG
jgi:hypothetical protein